MINRKKICENDAKLIWNVFQSRGKINAKIMCDGLGYKKSTFYKIINNEGQIHTKWKKLEKTKKWNDQQIETAINIIEESPQSTLKEIIENTTNMGFPTISESTLEKYLKVELISYKKNN